MANALCICSTCSDISSKVTCCCDGMCSMRTPIINAVRRHRLWPRTFKSDDLANIMHRHVCPMVELIELPHHSVKGANPPAYAYYLRKPMQTSSLVLDRDFHLMFDTTIRFGLGNDGCNLICHGFIQLVMTEEVAKRLRFIGTTEYIKVLDSDVITIAHDLMTTIDEHIFVGSRHLKIEHFDLTKNDWYGAEKLVKNTVLKFDCYISLDCHPFCESTFGYCPGCLDDEVTFPVRKTEAATGSDEPMDNHDKAISSEIHPPIELIPSGSDIPPESILVITPRGLSKIPAPVCPSAPRKPRGESRVAAFRRRASMASMTADKCTHCDEVHPQSCSPQ